MNLIFGLRLQLTLLTICVTSVPALAGDLEAFTEPYTEIAVPAPEIGVIAEILVREGQHVSQQQMLARLDDSVLQASLAVAKAAKDARGAKQSADADVTLRRTQLDSYRQLRDRGNATPRELQRAESAYQQSLSRLRSVQEDLEVKRLEYERVREQIRKRVMTAPVPGHVVSIVKEVGEFVSPNDPIVMHIAHLESLKAVFAVDLQAAARLQPNHTAVLRVGIDELTCRGVIEFVSPVADAESGTVRVKVRIPNTTGEIQSGVVCRWDLTTAPPADELAEQPDRNRKRNNR